MRRVVCVAWWCEKGACDQLRMGWAWAADSQLDCSTRQDCAACMRTRSSHFLPAHRMQQPQEVWCCDLQVHCARQISSLLYGCCLSCRLHLCLLMGRWHRALQAPGATTPQRIPAGEKAVTLSIHGHDNLYIQFTEQMDDDMIANHQHPVSTPLCLATGIHLLQILDD